ncbi:subtilisin-like protease [Streptomyces laurentii]|uniref:Subtilisin-like protease n=1 Tax=Streptomyces laurentii TaxID=39478 RepID=A0A160P920_STRLU|nr:subtilisin-like protease [Streptomyces laurentii]
MARFRSLLRFGLAVPVVLSLAASFGTAPASAAAVPRARSAAQAEDADVPTYVVNTRTDRRTIAEVRQAVTAAGGTIVVTYDRIGVIVAHATNPDFGARMRAVPGVRSAGATRATPLSAAGTNDEGPVRPLSRGEAARLEKAAGEGAEPLEAEQWDLPAIGADKAAKINPGSRNVTVAVIDTGVDDTHPDLAANFSPSQSASCVSGKADTTYGSWRPADVNYFHGTHVAGTIAAARNGVGIAGVAPGVRVSAITVSQPIPRQLIYAESVVCAFVFAADHGVQITNNSYYVDPWQYNCLDDPDQKAIVDAVNRAQLYAQRKGTLNVGGAGNSNDDLSTLPGAGGAAPGGSAPAKRTLAPRTCWDVPAQLPGVVMVSATSATNAKAYYSNYGLGEIDVAAPGGDQYQAADTPSGSGGILSTLPDNQYGYEQGTSMATPHVAGVAALLKSAHPQATPAQLQTMLKAQADNPGCPADPYDWNGDGVVDAVCAGDQRVNGFYGYGIVNAFRAVK